MIKDLMRDPVTIQLLLDQGAEPMRMNRVEFGNFFASEIERWKKVVRYEHLD